MNTRDEDSTEFLPKIKKKKIDDGTSDGISSNSNEKVTEQVKIETKHIPYAINGQATICFVSKELKSNDHKSHKHDADEHCHTKKHFFQGYLYNKTKKSFGLMGEEVPPKDRIPDCCLQEDDPPIWFKITIIDFASNLEYCCEVEKTGADFARLSSSEITFETASVKVDKQADEYISKFFPKLVSIDYDDALVCFGEMNILDAKFAPVSTSEEQIESSEENEGDENLEVVDETETKPQVVVSGEVDFLDD